MQGIIGRKIGMTQMFVKDSGKVVPVTVIKADNNVVHQIKTKERDGYSAVQLGFEILPEKKVNKPLMGHFKKHNSVPTRVIKEFKLDSPEEKLTEGQKIGLEIFENVKYVDISGISKGRGFTGCTKRHNFKRGPESHGSKSIRVRGSSGANTSPGHVFKGLRMEGQYGNSKVTMKNLELVSVDKDLGVLMVKGAVPGPNKGIVFIKKVKTK